MSPIIDAHVHLGQSSDFALTAWQLVSMMDSGGVDRAVAVPTCSSLRDNERLLLDIRRYSERLVGFVWVNPRSPGMVRSLDHLCSLAGFGGFKLGSESDIFRIDDVRLLKPVFELARGLRKPVFIHSSGEGSCSAPDRFAKIATTFPDVTIIVGHMGGGSYRAINVGRTYPNIVLETSGIEDPRIISEAIKALGPERVVFGSDLPYCNQRSEKAKIEALNVPAKYLEMVLGLNADRILGR